MRLPGAVTALCLTAAALTAQDPRDLATGHRIPDEGYCDQPRLVVTASGAWVCVLTTAAGREGSAGQHVVATRSTDRGATWSALVDVEPADPQRPASYAVTCITPFDRIYAFYTYNGDAVTTLPGKSERIRADTQGWFCYRWSDDEGRTWSPRRRLPMRVTACDRANDWGGDVQMFWAIGRPVRSSDGAVLFAFTRLRRYFLQDGEGWFYRCANLDRERDVAALEWELLPDGDHGLRRADFGSVQEEFNLAPLRGGRLFCVYRTTLGFPCEAYSDDGGHTWTQPEPMRYAADGRVFRNPRACPKVWRCANGKYLFWFHHHGGKDFHGRNPAWLCGGVEKDGRLVWSEPEIVLFADEAAVRMSYPDLIEDGGEYFVAQTQKEVARVHRIDRRLVEDLWRQVDGGKMAVPEDDAGAGFSLEAWIAFDDTQEAVLLDGRGLSLRAVPVGGDRVAVQIDFDAGDERATWTSDPFAAAGLHHLVFTVDASARIVTVVRDGRLDDGGASRTAGWGRFAGEPKVGAGEPRRGVGVRSARLWGRPLRTAEAVAVFRAGAGEGLQPGARDGR